MEFHMWKTLEMYKLEVVKYAKVLGLRNRLKYLLSFDTKQYKNKVVDELK